MKKKKSQNKKLITKLMKAFLPFILLVVSACTMGKNRTLKNYTYDLGRSSKLAISSFKRTEKKMEFKLLGISFGADSVVIKANEIECGAGKTKFSKVRAQSDQDNLIILPKSYYLEFDVICIHESEVAKDQVPYLLFKSLYQLKGKAQGQVLDSMVKISFE